MKRKLLSVLLTLCLAFSLLPTAALADEVTGCVGGETCSHQAAIGSTHYDTLQEAVNAANDGDTVTLLKDVETNNIEDTEAARIIIKKAITLNLNDKTIKSPDNMGNNNKNFCALFINNKDVTINATAGGGINTGTNGGYGINVLNGATLTINGGTYYGGGTAVQVQKGTLIINDGHFSCEPFGEPYGYKYLINCIDKAWKDGTAKISIKGGSFVNYDPSDSASENPIGNFCASGYVAVKGGTDDAPVWTVEDHRVAEVGNNGYSTLAAAVAAAQDGNTITLLKDSVGSGIGTYKDPGKDMCGNQQIAAKGFTIDFNGHTYSVDRPAVGSKKYETQGFHLEWKGSVETTPNITLKNGTLNVAEQHDRNLKLLIQNYCNLTLDNMTVDGTNLTKGWGTYTYVTSNCNGTVKIKDTTIISENPSLDVAFDVDGDKDGRPYGAVSLTIEGNSKISGKFEFNTNRGGNKLSISAGYFTSDPTAYLAADKGLVTSDQNAFAYKVGDKDTDVETAVTAGEAVVTIPVGVDGITEDTVKNAAKAANTTKTLTDTVAASGMTNDPAVVGTKEAAEAALTAKGIPVNSGDTVTVVVQPYLEVNVKSADDGKLTLEISAKYNVVATTGSPVTIDPDKTATLKSGVPLSINKPIELTIVLPTGFAAVNSKIYVQHKGYEYTATVDASGATATFINPHGFSTFTVTSTASAVAEVDGTNYTDLQKAVDAVANNGTVKLLNDTSASAVVSRAVKFTLDKNSKSFTGAITAGSGYELSVDGNVYTFTVRSSSGSSGGSSSSSRRYDVSAPSVKHGTVTVSPKNASKGDRVTVTVKPDSGYVLETLTVTDKNGNELTLKDKGNGKYTFTMPAGKVEVKATFMEDNSMLNFFYDVPNNAYFYEAVKWAVENGITTGVGNDLFAPEQPCTRAQIVTFLWRAAGSPEPKGAASGMTDVVSGSYYEKAVAWAIENGITTGTTTTTFSPDVTCTRAQAVTFLARALKAKAASAAEFSDVPNDSYFADAVAWAAANGVTEGIGGGLFGSDNDCTRGQIVTFLYRAYNK